MAVLDNSGVPTAVEQGGLPSAVQTVEGAACHDYGSTAGHGENKKLLYPLPTAATAAYYSPGIIAGEAIPLAAQVFADNATGGPISAVGQNKIAGAGAFTKHLRRSLLVLGLSVASLAVTGLAAGAPTAATGFGLFLTLIVGLSAVTIRVHRA